MGDDEADWQVELTVVAAQGSPFAQEDPIVSELHDAVVAGIRDKDVREVIHHRVLRLVQAAVTTVDAVRLDPAGESPSHLA